MEGNKVAEPICSVIIPVCNGHFYTRLCLEQLRRTRPGEPPFELIIVDNGSRDDTPALLADFADIVSEVITNDSNQGFAKACNQGARAARGKYLVLLNNDIVVEPGWLHALVSMAEADPRTGVVGARLLYPDGTIQHAGMVFLESLVPHHILSGYPGDWPDALVARDFQAVTGACMLIERALFNAVNGLDEGYENSFEDLDLCLKVRRLGRRVTYCPRSVSYHFESVTAGRSMRDDRNLALFLDRWRDELVIDHGTSNQVGPAMASTASLMRLERATLVAENERLRSLCVGSVERLASTWPERQTAQADSCPADLLYLPARPSPTVAGGVVRVPVVVENTGTRDWKPGQLTLGYHWKEDGATEYLVRDGVGARIAESLKAGQKIVVWATLAMPSCSGDYVLEWDALEDQVAWMADLGIPPFCQHVRVVKPSNTVATYEGLPLTLRTGQEFDIQVRLVDNATCWEDLSPLLLYRWHASLGLPPVTGVPVQVRSASDRGGDATRVSIAVVAPAVAGTYRLELCEWSSSDGWMPVQVAGVEVQVLGGAQPQPVSTEMRNSGAIEDLAYWQARAEELEYALSRGRPRLPELAGFLLRHDDSRAIKALTAIGRWSLRFRQHLKPGF